ncbi:MAG: alpha/beta fold hydrolase [Pseudodonghicola sp.]
MTEPVQHRIDTGAARICVHEWGAEHRGARPTLMLSHATGFHGRCWDRVIARLGPRHILAPDLRGHGRSSAAAFADWRELGADLAGVLAALELTGVHAVGHSVGGAATALAALAAPDRFARLTLIDPVICPPEIYAQGVNPMAAPEGELHPIARRKARFASLDDMQAQLGARPPYALFDPRVMQDYCRFGTAEEAGERVLLCAPEFEASVYQSALVFAGIHAAMADLRPPTLVVRAQRPRRPEDWRDFRFSPTDPALAAHLPRGRDLYLPQFTHFIPQQSPDFCAGMILAGEAVL